MILKAIKVEMEIFKNKKINNKSKYLNLICFLLTIPVTGKTASTQLPVFSSVSSPVWGSPPSKTVPPAASPTISPLFLLHLEVANLKYVCVAVLACNRVLGFFSELWNILIFQATRLQLLIPCHLCPMQSHPLILSTRDS